ncbi:MAG: hypothetical protein IJ806_03360 [Ruminococcus sp.]|nr:hypothetical protein [Ruminococcus sp.]
MLTFTVVKEDGKLRRKKFSIPGTLGQCLLTYPEGGDLSEAPFALYHAGGVIFNGIGALISVLVFVLSSGPWPRMMSAVFGIISIYQGLVNFIPMAPGGVPNDGKNLFILKKDPDARRALMNTIIVNGYLSRGKTYGDIPPERFETADPEGDIFQQGGAIDVGLMLEYRHEFEEAREIFQKLADNSQGLELYKNIAVGEIMLCMMLTGASKEEVDGLMTDKVKKYMSATENYVVQRKCYRYAYELMMDQDKAAAEKVREEAVKMGGTYPIPGEYKMVIELIDYIKTLG